ncbi:glycerate kinase family protein [Scatolibacter rhodanostii]|uniref:glycerate kinase family protein n=1 Tax=Scatolibacter rhodanostii TaxID=2014781 RepID=UPI000C074D41|nr:glycerate kinase [Scatolibacter rhodanostii]
MKKVILIPDSFKGTMSSDTVCHIMEQEIKAVYPNAQIVSIPVADGGEGSVDCFLSAVGGTKKTVSVKGVFGEEMQAFYGLLADSETAVIEMACCAGLPLAEGRLNPLTATTYGVGQLLLAAVKNGAKHIILGLGGSATNDGACGMAAACGVRFTDKNGKDFIPTGGTLKDIDHIDVSGIEPSLHDVKITAMCDIDNPMFGENGAAYIFAPQKGADEVMVKELDDGLRHLNEICQKDLGKDLSTLSGGGAAGAMGAGVYAFLGAKLQMGIQTVLDCVKFDEQLADTDLIFTGEGKIDGQSLRGKVVIGVAQQAVKQNVPVIAIVGDIAPGSERAYEKGVTAIFSINAVAMDFPKIKPYSKEYLATTMKNIMRFSSIF